MVRHERVGQHDDATELLYATHQCNRAVLLLVVKEERTVRKPADKVIAPVLLDNPVLFFLMWALYQKLGYCINFTVSMSSDPSFLPFSVSPSPDVIRFCSSSRVIIHSPDIPYYELFYVIVGFLRLNCFCHHYISNIVSAGSQRLFPLLLTKGRCDLHVI